MTKRSDSTSGRPARNDDSSSEDYGEDVRVLPRPEHPISRKKISGSALKVLYRLNNAGYDAYLVGGGVRDLLLGRHPKDFDIATDATPAEVRRLFRNSRIIGRRFRLVHVMFRDGVVEVSTFRANPDPEEQKRRPGELLVTSDNTFGTPREDAFRRDFTVNAMFYNVDDYSVIDYVGGIEDLHRGVIRVIGEPRLRFHEDPVRMMRACEFAGRLGFSISEATQRGIERTRREILKASPARLTEELLQILRSGASGPTFQWMHDLGLLELVLPEVEGFLRGDEGGDFGRLLPAIDSAVAEGGAFSDTVLFAALLVPKVISERYRLEKNGSASRGRLARVVDRVVGEFSERYSLSAQRRDRLVQSLETFQRLCEPVESERLRSQIVRRSSFNDALDLFSLLVEATGDGQDVYEEWRQAAVAFRRSGGKRRTPPERPKSRPRRRRRRPRRKG